MLPLLHSLSHSLPQAISVSLNISIKVSLSYQAFPIALVPGKQLNMGGVGDGSLLNHLDKGHVHLKFFVLPRIALTLITLILVIK